MRLIDNERMLLRAVVDNDQKKAQDCARIILNNITSQRDQTFKESLLRKLDTKTNFIELPYNLKELLAAEDVTDYPMGKFLIRSREEEITEKILAVYRASNRLIELEISYLPAMILYGQSGTGKTELVRYIAHKAGLPFVYVRFSSLVNSYLGGTQSNINKVFSYAKSSPCVLCFDEIDAIGMKRGDSHDVSEMSRVVIALMQEMDSLPNNVIIIGTTNRFDRLDPALIRRFPLNYQIMPLSRREILELSDKLLKYAGYGMDEEKLQNWCDYNFEALDLAADGNGVPVSEVVTRCTDYIVSQIVAEEASYPYTPPKEADHEAG